MMLDTAQSMAMLVVMALMVVILVRILALVHKQSKRVNDIEAKMRLMDKMKEETVNKEEEANG